MPNQPRAPQRPTYHHGNLRQALLTTALDIVETQGVERLTMRELTLRTGVSRTAPYRHFANKQELLCAIAEAGFRQLTRTYAQVISATTGNGLAVLLAISRSYLTFALENPAQYRIMFGPLLTDHNRTDDLRIAASETFSHLLHAIDRCQAEGLIEEGNTLALANAAWSMAHGLASLLIDGQLQTAETGLGPPTLLTADTRRTPADAQQAAAIAFEALIRGMGTRSSSG